MRGIFYCTIARLHSVGAAEVVAAPLPRSSRVGRQTKLAERPAPIKWPTNCVRLDTRYLRLLVVVVAGKSLSRPPLPTALGGLSEPLVCE